MDLSVRYLPLVFPAPDALLARVLETVTWEDRMRARRTASFGRPYDYAAQHYAEAPMPAVIAEIRDVAAAHAGHPFDNCLGNLYATGASTMGFHHDSYDELVADSFIAIVSLGAVRTLRFRTRDKAHERSFALAAGSLLLMDAETQRDWLHAVKREPGAGLRVSLTFRRFKEA